MLESISNKGAGLPHLFSGYSWPNCLLEMESGCISPTLFTYVCCFQTLRGGHCSLFVSQRKWSKGNIYITVNFFF